jgi:hypothetical protein
MNSLNYSEMRAAIGLTKIACKKKVYKIYGAGVLNQETINDIRSRCLANKISNILSLMHLANMLDTSGPPREGLLLLSLLDIGAFM